jgi:urease accessory protein
MIATIHIQVCNKHNLPILLKSYCTTPFKIVNITEDKSNPTLQLMLMSSSPGILSGDAYDILIEVAENTALQLHTQAYQRLFNMQLCATQTANVHIQAHASFIYLPHPTVPHAGASFVNTNNFYLQKNSTLIFGEVLTCGRKLNNEAFLFNKYHSITNIFMQSKLVIKENLLMQPSVLDVTTMGQLEGYTHQASMVCIHYKIVVQQTIPLIIKILQPQTGIEFGISATPINGVMIRLLGNGAEQLFSCLQQILALLMQQLKQL